MMRQLLLTHENRHLKDKDGYGFLLARRLGLALLGGSGSALSGGLALLGRLLSGEFWSYVVS